MLDATVVTRLLVITFPAFYTGRITGSRRSLRSVSASQMQEQNTRPGYAAHPQGCRGWLDGLGFFTHKGLEEHNNLSGSRRIWDSEIYWRFSPAGLGRSVWFVAFIHEADFQHQSQDTECQDVTADPMPVNSPGRMRRTKRAKGQPAHTLHTLNHP